LLEGGILRSISFGAFPNRKLSEEEKKRREEKNHIFMKRKNGERE
jgi:hypothetical protein